MDRQTQNIVNAISIQKTYKDILDKASLDKLYLYKTHISIVELKNDITMAKIREICPDGIWENKCTICNENKDELFVCTTTDEYLNGVEFSICKECNIKISTMFN